MEEDIHVRIECDPILHGMGQLLENQASIMQFMVNALKDLTATEKSILRYQAEITKQQGRALQVRAYVIDDGTTYED